MKKRFAAMIALVLAFSMAGCSGGATANTDEAEITATEAEPETETETETEAEPEEIKKTDYVEVEGIYVDDSYISEENDSFKMVYVFYNAFTNDKNISISSFSDLTVNDINSYDSTTVGNGEIMGSYYYSNYIEDLYIGDSMKVLSTYLVPEAELESGRTLSFDFSGIPDTGKLKMRTDDIIYCDSPVAIAELADAEGYADYQHKLEPADEETAAKVKAAVNGRYTMLPTYNLKVSFSDPDRFEVSFAGITNGGTYVVTNGYLACTYDGEVDLSGNQINDEKSTIYIPWTEEADGSISYNVHVLTE